MKRLKMDCRDFSSETQKQVLEQLPHRRVPRLFVAIKAETLDEERDDATKHPVSSGAIGFGPPCIRPSRRWTDRNAKGVFEENLQRGIRSERVHISLTELKGTIGYLSRKDKLLYDAKFDKLLVIAMEAREVPDRFWERQSYIDIREFPRTGEVQPSLR